MARSADREDCAVYAAYCYPTSIELDLGGARVELVGTYPWTVRRLGFIFQAPVALNPLVSLMGRLVACSARISGDTYTQTQTDRTTTLTQ